MRHTINWLAPTSEINAQLSSNQGKGILDLANPWQPDSATSGYAVIKVRGSDGQFASSTFNAHLVSGTVPAVSKDTTPYFYVLDDPQAATNFVSQQSLGQTNTEVEAEFVFTAIQVDCTIPTGDYTNHLRHEDSSGVTYYDSFTFQYFVPDNVQGSNRCEQATITLK